MSDELPSLVWSVAGSTNAQTRMPKVSDGPCIELDRMAEVFAAAREFAPPRAGVGYRIFWGRTKEDVAFLDLPVGRDAYAILGRHACCDAVLDGDAELSLRHL